LEGFLKGYYSQEIWPEKKLLALARLIMNASSKPRKAKKPYKKISELRISRGCGTWPIILLKLKSLQW